MIAIRRTPAILIPEEQVRYLNGVVARDDYRKAAERSYVPEETCKGIAALIRNRPPDTKFGASWLTVHEANMLLPPDFRAKYGIQSVDPARGFDPAAIVRGWLRNHRHVKLVSREVTRDLILGNPGNIDHRVLVSRKHPTELVFELMVPVRPGSLDVTQILLWYQTFGDGTGILWFIDSRADVEPDVNEHRKGLSRLILNLFTICFKYHIRSRMTKDVRVLLRPLNFGPLAFDHDALNPIVNLLALRSALAGGNYFFKREHVGRHLLLLLADAVGLDVDPIDYKYGLFADLPKTFKEEHQERLEGMDHDQLLLKSWYTLAFVPPPADSSMYIPGLPSLQVILNPDTGTPEFAMSATGSVAADVITLPGEEDEEGDKPDEEVTGSSDEEESEDSDPDIEDHAALLASQVLDLQVGIDALKSDLDRSKQEERSRSSHGSTVSELAASTNTQLRLLTGILQQVASAMAKTDSTMQSMQHWQQQYIMATSSISGATNSSADVPTRRTLAPLSNRIRSRSHSGGLPDLPPHHEVLQNAATLSDDGDPEYLPSGDFSDLDSPPTPQPGQLKAEKGAKRAKFRSITDWSEYLKLVEVRVHPVLRKEFLCMAAPSFRHYVDELRRRSKCGKLKVTFEAVPAVCAVCSQTFNNPFRHSAQPPVSPALQHPEPRELTQGMYLLPDSVNDKGEPQVSAEKYSFASKLIAKVENEFTAHPSGFKDINTGPLERTSLWRLCGKRCIGPQDRKSTATTGPAQPLSRLALLLLCPA